jgi:hypothetical protein
MNQICLKPWEPDLGFHVKTHPVLSFHKWFFPVLVLLVGSHMGENLKTSFQLSFHPKWEHENWVTHWEPPNTDIHLDNILYWPSLEYKQVNCNDSRLLGRLWLSEYWMWFASLVPDWCASGDSQQLSWSELEHDPKYMMWVLYCLWIAVCMCQVYVRKVPIRQRWSCVVGMWWSCIDYYSSIQEYQ